MREGERLRVRRSRGEQVIMGEKQREKKNESG